MTETTVCIGRGERGEDLVLDLGKPYHYAIQGMTRSGKSNLMYCLLAEALRHEHVVVAGCDPTGILLAPFRATASPEFRFLGGRVLDGAVETLDTLVSEMDRRISVLLLRESDSFSNFSCAEPLIIVVMEEYPGLLAAAEAHDSAEGLRGALRIAPAIARDVQRLVQESAKVGFRVMILAQRAEASVLGSAVRSNLGVRITLRVDNADSVRMLHPQAPPALVKRAGVFVPGEAIIDRPGLATTTFRADVLPYEGYLAIIRALVAKSANSRENLQEGCEDAERI